MLEDFDDFINQQQPWTKTRQTIHSSVFTTAQSGETFKLQFATRSGTCDTAFSGETYADVTAATAVAYNDNTTPADGDTLTGNANDPVHSGHTTNDQTYEELNNFTNSVSSIPVGEDGMWDFSLIDNNGTGLESHELSGLQACIAYADDQHGDDHRNGQ